MNAEAIRAARVLVVDDEEMNVRALTRLLDRGQYRNVRATTDPTKVIDLFREFDPDLLLLDLRMPELDGFEVMDLLRREIPEDTYFPILVLTGDLSPEVRERALSVGARDFVTKPFDVTEALLRIRNLLEARILHLELRNYAETLETRVRERTKDLADAQIEILNRLAVAAEYRDDITGRHAERVGLLSALIAKELGRPEREVRLLRRAATLHDVGKIGVSDSILMKPSGLTDEEYNRMKRHTEIGDRILSGSRFPLLRLASEIAISHHEWWNGNGYGAGLSGDEIPISGRIVTVADVYDSLMHERPYKKAFTSDEARRLIEEGRGSQFDPDVVDAFFSLVGQGVLDNLDRLLDEDPFHGDDIPLDGAFEGPARDPADSPSEA
jgi:putative two-component system response regulator